MFSRNGSSLKNTLNNADHKVTNMPWLCFVDGNGLKYGVAGFMFEKQSFVMLATVRAYLKFYSLQIPTLKIGHTDIEIKIREAS